MSDSRSSFSAFLRAIVVALIVVAADGLAQTAHASGWASLNEAEPRPARITPISENAQHHYIQFSARRGPGSITGHLNMRTVAVLGDGRHELTLLFGLYAIGRKYAASLVGTPGIVGYTQLDLKEKPTASYRIRISEAMHARLLRAVRHFSRTERWFELFGRNCNYLAGRVARIIGLRVPANVVQLPES